MVKACLFDLDGVVFDTEPLYTLFWNNIGKKFRPNVPNFEYIIKGQTLVQIFDKYFADDVDAQKEIVKLSNEYERHIPYNYILGFESFIDNWYKAFDIKEGDKLFVPQQNRAHIW